ncbi:MAG: ester cyclase [Hyphomonadaceae bacterium]|nr:ester cyclase [Hyphomonadaceae bacterium]
MREQITWVRAWIAGAICVALAACSPGEQASKGLAETAAAAAPAVAAPDHAKEANKAVAIAFYNAALNDKDWNAASKLIGSHYTQHNPAAVDGVEGIKAHVENLKKNFPLNHGEIKRAFVDGDIVILHIHSKRTPESLGNAIVDMFRIEDGKVVEHWDVVQRVPEAKDARNANTMF